MTPESFESFFAEHAERVYNYLLRLTGDPHRAGDVFQQSFLKAFTHFRERRDSGATRAWIYTIATNTARDEARRSRRHPVEYGDVADRLESRREDPSVTAADRELAARILAAVETLPPMQREIFLLVRYHGFAYAEAAYIAGIGVSAAKMAVMRAHEKLARKLEITHELQEDE